MGALLARDDETGVPVSISDLVDAAGGMSLDNCRLVDALIDNVLTNKLGHEAVEL